MDFELDNDRDIYISLFSNDIDSHIMSMPAQREIEETVADPHIGNSDKVHVIRELGMMELYLGLFRSES